MTPARTGLFKTRPGRFPGCNGWQPSLDLQDPDLLRFIDMECFCWSVMPADRTPMINAGMVFSDRHAGGINYPQ